jgi:hypothetical protein
MEARTSGSSSGGLRSRCAGRSSRGGTRRAHCRQ